MKSRLGPSNTHIAGDNLVTLSGDLRYCRIARCKKSVSSSPFGPVLSVIKRLTVLRQLQLCNCYAEKQPMKGDDALPILGIVL